MKNFKNAAYFLSLVSLQAFGMNGPLALASVIFDSSTAASPESATAEKRSTTQMQREKAAYEKLVKANDKVAQAMKMKGIIDLKIKSIIGELKEGSIFDFSGYAQAVSAQEKRCELSAARLEEIEIVAAYNAVLSEWQKAEDEYSFVKKGQRANFPLAYEPPTFIPAKIIQGSTAAVLHNSK